MIAAITQSLGTQTSRINGVMVKKTMDKIKLVCVFMGLLP